MRGVSFIWNRDINDDSKRDIGFVAQEIAHVMPELVFKSTTTDESFYQVKYHDIIALCLEAIKEQSEVIDSKETKLEQLELIATEKGLI
jgi:hypothetical protein